MVLLHFGHAEAIEGAAPVPPRTRSTRRQGVGRSRCPGCLGQDPKSRTEPDYARARRRPREAAKGPRQEVEVVPSPTTGRLGTAALLVGVGPVDLPLR